MIDRLFSRTTITRLAALALVVAILVGGCDKDLSLNPSKNKVLTDDERMEWWRDARFGLFVHWGLYAVPAGTYQGRRIDGIGEWIMNSAQIPVEEYEKFAARFNPIGYDADEWVRLAKNAGAKYIVITSKHHDGFCLWDSKVTNYDVMDATPFKRDILAELAKACKKHKIKLCFYHSIMDWHHPDAQAPFFPNYNDTSRSNPNFDRYVEQYMKPQLAELLAKYGPLGVLWFDGEWIKDWTEPKGKALYAWLRELQPDLIINNRVGKGRQGMEGLNKGDGEYAGDFGTPEQQVPATGLPGVDWETCMTMNDTWGFKSYDENWKSSAELIRTLVETASKGGNFLLNVGPTPEGLIPQASVERLEAMGQWMAVNSESIYGTTASPIGKPEWGYCTAKGETLYLHVTEWPADGKLSVKLANAGAAKAHLLADKKNKALPVACTDNQVTVTLPGEAPDAVVSVVVLTVNAK